MSEPFLGEIRVFAFGVVPRGWAPCNGELLAINQNRALFALLGTTYGGDGQITFALPNLQGRLAIGYADGITLGQTGGELAHTLVTAEMPSHVHAAQGSGISAKTERPDPSVTLAQSNGAPLYAPPGRTTTMSPNAIGPAGQTQPHENMMPFLVLNVCISVGGTFPPQ